MSAPTLGERFDDIGARLSAAYDARAKYEWNTPAWHTADAALEAVYADLRTLNAEVAAR